MIYFEGAGEYLAYKENLQHQAYIIGYADGSFRPDAFVTRAQMATMLSRNLANENALDSKHSFKDVSSDYWAANAIAIFNELDMMTGYTNGEFGPQDHITRAKMATFAYRWINKKCSSDSGSYTFCVTLGNKAEPYRDIPQNYWANEAITVIRNSGIMEGYGDNTSI
ncbi:S-layer homology domain-containing protein [Falsibacillus albus]|uniref:S-layer homology domain-containing protein n=1 Tax=Falsibacillus albus TaxID=2478915 RepID=A0A3L7K477_9BACI|nr:S-layer homology domain-containing protein [Falsibacillus albus]RLQ96821.1 S-layer homology domain-containing protein [Falsibacillus albus]